mmetsp:Transcript_956/g.2166  ORF Transcript_956/g.2166 Transcript_956/m.2166 type:complete len:263 (+) Transcript_956:209-997(+)
MTICIHMASHNVHGSRHSRQAKREDLRFSLRLLLFRSASIFICRWCGGLHCAGSCRCRRLRRLHIGSRLRTLRRRSRASDAEATKIGRCNLRQAERALCLDCKVNSFHQDGKVLRFFLGLVNVAILSLVPSEGDFGYALLWDAYVLLWQACAGCAWLAASFWIIRGRSACLRLLRGKGRRRSLCIYKSCCLRLLLLRSFCIYKSCCLGLLLLTRLGRRFLLFSSSFALCRRCLSLGCLPRIKLRPGKQECRRNHRGKHWHPC